MQKLTPTPEKGCFGPEADLVAMFRLLPEEEREDIFDIVHLKYGRHLGKRDAVPRSAKITPKQRDIFAKMPSPCPIGCAATVPGFLNPKNFSTAKGQRKRMQQMRTPAPHRLTSRP